MTKCRAGFATESTVSYTNKKYETMVISNIEIILFLNVSTTLKSSSGVD